MENNNIIRLTGVSKSYMVGGEIVHGLRDVSLAVTPGEYIAVMGPSGSGKSTLLNVIGLLDQADSGQLVLEGKDVSGLNDEERTRMRRERIGFIFQFFHLIPRLTAAENIELPMVLAGIRPAERQQRVGAILDLVGLRERASHKPDQLSGGQRQRVAIARSTIMRPAVLLADEPTGNLDRASGYEVISILEGLNDQGLTLIMVTHDPDLGRRARRKINMDDGAVVGGRGLSS